jgi:ketosteroid isomerase-like protein
MLGSPGTESERSLKRDAEWTALVSEGLDTDRILSYRSDDAVAFAPGFPPNSRRVAFRADV